MPRKFYIKKDPERVNWQQAYERQVEINKEQLVAFIYAHEENKVLKQKLKEQGDDRD